MVIPDILLGMQHILTYIHICIQPATCIYIIIQITYYISYSQNTKESCRKMFKKWLESQENASWDQLLKALRSRSVQLNTLAKKIENMLVGNGK